MSALSTTLVGAEFAQLRNKRSNGDHAGWWRVELREDGSVSSCRPIAGDGPRAGSAHVFYVLAFDPAGAERLARHQLNEYARLRQKERNAQLAHEGKCRCGREYLGRGRCPDCREKDALYKQRDAARRRGEHVPELSRREALQARRTDEASELRNEASCETRKSVLLEVRAAWEGASTVTVFRLWLRDQLESLGVTE